MTSTATRARATEPDALTAADDATRSARRMRAEQLECVHACIASGAWHRRGHRSPTQWLVATTFESVGTCAVTVELAERVQEMPIVRDRFAAGDLSESALRLLARSWHADIAHTFARDEQMLVGWALNLAHDDFKKVLAVWRQRTDPDREERTAQEQFESRHLHLSSLLDGMGRLDGLLDPEGHRTVTEAIRALSVRCEGDTRTIEQRRADALVSMAKSALSTHTPDPGRKRSRPKFMATADYDDLVTRSGGGTLETNGGSIVVTPDTIRRLCCDAGMHRLITTGGSTVLDFGRQTRSVSDSLFDVLVVRDHGCRLGIGCPVGPDGCDAHHALHWVDDGETEPDNLVLACWYHHHLLHEQHWSLEPLGGGHFILRDQHGTEMPMRPPMIGLALPQLPLPLAS
jgi:hypothetical protein